jgi:hypothetical protein
MEESRNKRADWEDRLKALLSKFREDNMSDYRMSAEYKDNQEEIQKEYQQLGKLDLGKDVMNAIQDFGDVENAAATDYMEQAYIQGICDGIRFVKFFQQD